MIIRASNKITIQGATEPMKEAIIKKLTIANPLFYKKKRMGLWVSEKDRFFRYYEQPDPDTLIVPRGLLTRIKNFFPEVIVEEDFVCKKF
jgi:hypothetical protein